MYNRILGISILTHVIAIRNFPINNLISLSLAYRYTIMRSFIDSKLRVKFVFLKLCSLNAVMSNMQLVGRIACGARADFKWPARA